jgi:cysteinyl-tRNA synthetase
MRLYNTLTRTREEVRPLQDKRIRIYSCGPTVYRYIHIGNLRTYLMADWLRRALQQKGYDVFHVKNITDVGHQRQELLERGEDKVVAQARAEGHTPRQIADFYTEAFLEDERALNILPADVFPRATAHVDGMKKLTARLIQSGHAYEKGGNVYYAVNSFPGYGELSGNLGGDDLQEAVRVEADPLKNDPRDFTLWKAAEPGREMKWESPWGEGFPGWHIECSAMSIELLGDRFEIHTGGVDNIFPHHEDERAQSDAAAGHPVVGLWLHGQHLLVDGLKMAKSTGNVFGVRELRERDYDPLAFRYLCAMTHPRRRMNFTFEALRGAQRALDRLRARISHDAFHHEESHEDSTNPLRERFWQAVEDDLNIPSAMAATWEAARSTSLDDACRSSLLLEFDEVLGLGLHESAHNLENAATERHDFTDRIQRARSAGNYREADELRRAMNVEGFEVRETNDGVELHLRQNPSDGDLVSSSDDLPSNLDRPDSYQFSICLVARDNGPELRRCVAAFLANAADVSIEVIVVDSGASPACREVVNGLGRDFEGRIKLVRADHDLGTAAANNAAMRTARGRYIVLADSSIEPVGDVYRPIDAILHSPEVGLTGPFGVRSTDLREFEEASGEVDAVEAYLMAFPRAMIGRVGLMDEKFRFYRHLDLDYSLRFKDAGYRLRTVELPVRRHEHVEWQRTAPEERDRLSKRNFYRFLHRWGHRADLLVGAASSGSRS